MDCGFRRDSKWFRYRAAAIIIEDGEVLFAKNELNPYYYSVGGGVHHGESAEDAVRREVLEETGIAYEVDRLAFVHENFFEDATVIGEAQAEELHCHEITLYFLMKSRGTKALASDSYTLGVKENMHWLPIERLSEYIAYPRFFVEELEKLGQQVKHIVTQETKE